jgi:hypothetical protein
MGDDEPVETTCDHCGKVALCDYLPDPFLEEVHPEEPNPPSWWCGDCHRNRRQDV